MQIDYSKAAAKYINSLDKPSQERIRAGIEGIPKGDIKPLRGSPGSRRLRIGNWRIIFSYSDNNTILIEKIGPRGGVYKGG